MNFLQTILLNIVTCQVVYLVFRLQNAALQTKASVASDVLSLVALCGAVVLSYYDHIRSVRPSTLLSSYLSVVILLNIARVRTLWMTTNTKSASVTLSISLASTVVSLILESTEKRASVKYLPPDATPEQFSGFWKRTSFAWLLPTLRQGYSKILSVPNLPTLDPRLNSNILHDKLEKTWNKCRKSETMAEHVLTLSR